MNDIPKVPSKSLFLRLCRQKGMTGGQIKQEYEKRYGGNLEIRVNRSGQCNCDTRTKLVGDGCAICNPDYWDDQKDEDDHFDSGLQHSEPEASPRSKTG